MVQVSAHSSYGMWWPAARHSSVQPVCAGCGGLAEVTYWFAPIGQHLHLERGKSITLGAVDGEPCYWCLEVWYSFRKSLACPVLCALK